MQTRFPTPAEREKRARLLSLLDEGMVLVRIDASRTGVDVPPHLLGTPGLALNLSRRFRGPLEVGPLEVRATLSFNGVQHTCVLPYDAVYLMQSHSSGEVVVFPDDAPAAFREVLRRVAQMASELEPGVEGEEDGALGGALAAGAPEDATDETPPEDPDDGGRPRRGHLRLVD
jgi:stringent starvation protein B